MYAKQVPGKGWGVFCKRAIPKGTVFHDCPYFLIPREEQHLVLQTVVARYHYDMPKDCSAVCLGFGSLFNHASKGANITWRKSHKKKIFSFFALKNIPAETELVSDYGWEKEFYKEFGMKE